jgi:hypothetical protein
VPCGAITFIDPQPGADTTESQVPDWLSFDIFVAPPRTQSTNPSDRTLKTAATYGKESYLYERQIVAAANAN